MEGDAEKWSRLKHGVWVELRVWLKYDAAHGLVRMVRLTKNEASMCQFMHKRKRRSSSPGPIIGKAPTQPFSALSDSQYFAECSSLKNAKVDHWEMARHTILLGPTTIEMAPMLRQSGSWSCEYNLYTVRLQRNTVHFHQSGTRNIGVIKAGR